MSQTIKRRKHYTLTKRKVGNREVVSINVDASNRAFLEDLHLVAHGFVPKNGDPLRALAFDLGELLDLPFRLEVQP